ncbi:CSLREA domain-containing protein [Solirubrobacter soli]|uniref:CSLREA domain-containing protein n=1 Tax=Solirubrobacter soli TaxID=363832 RepID=UPI0004105D66|nr:CSLREA domain-containing protein [Solirubrobacter soli]
MLTRLALALVAVGLLPATARAASFTVNVATDDTVCNTVTCSLRGAITAANGNGTAELDVITVPAGQYVLSSQFPALSIASNQQIEVRGGGANGTSIEPQTGFNVRVLLVSSNAIVSLSDLTLRGGVATGSGGNLLVSGAAVTLTRTRIVSGNAPTGGGVAITGSSLNSTLTIRQSLIDGNNATGTTSAAAGGGLYVEGQTFPATVAVSDSTFFGNSAGNGGAVQVTNSGTVGFRGVTFAGNNARAVSPAAGAGGVASAGVKVAFQGSILTRNTRTVNFGGGPVSSPSNCDITNGATDEGGNVTPDTDQCGLGGVHVDPQLDLVPDNSFEPPVMKIPANSSAVDAASCGGRTVDQRGVARPQLNACDAGAFEYQPPPPEPTPTPTPPVVTPTPTPTATPTPTPVRNTSVGATPVRGTVLVKQPGASRFVELDPSVIRNNSEVDTRKGRVEITTSTNEKAVFYDGIFKISQKGGLTTLTLTEALSCPKRGKASAAAAKPKTRKLWGDGKGKFRTKGSYSAATVRGTKWLVQDTCTSTTTRVTQGVVQVENLVTHKKQTVRKGGRYVARARR